MIFFLCPRTAYNRNHSASSRALHFHVDMASPMGRNELSLLCLSQGCTVDDAKGKQKPVHKWHSGIISAGAELGRLLRENKVLFLKGSNTGGNHKQPSGMRVVFL